MVLSAASGLVEFLFGRHPGVCLAWYGGEVLGAEEGTVALFAGEGGGEVGEVGRERGFGEGGELIPQGLGIGFGENDVVGGEELVAEKVEGDDIGGAVTDEFEAGGGVAGGGPLPP